MNDSIKVIPIKKSRIKMSKDEKEKCSLISHEDVFKTIKRETRERNKRYRSWLGWFWKAHDWCYWTFWSILRSHPLKETKWFLQRGFRGWSDYDAWGACNYLPRVISGITAYLAEKPNAHPGNVKCINEWKTILKKISKAFNLIDKKDYYNAALWKRDSTLARKCDMQTHDEHVKVEEGWYLFRKWFYSLWD
jgi:hypothetical protein